MATVRLGRYEVEECDLPRVCMRCGAPAVTYKRRRFRWFPAWLIVTFPFGILPYIILTEVMTQRMTVRVPYCERHQKRPLWPILVYAGILFALVGLAIGLMVLLRRTSAGGLICLGGFLAFFVWCMAAAVIGTPGIRPTKITDNSITLKGVCDEFIAALEADRRGSDSGGDSPRAKRRAADEGEGGYYDPEAKRRRRDREDDEDDR